MITFKDVEIKFGDFQAIKKLNLEIKEGEFFTLLGPSGCGKTTTLRSLVGFITPTSGSIIVDGEDITHKPIEKREIGMVFQSYALFPTMTVEENIAFGLKEKKKYTKEEIKRKVLDMAKVVELNETQLAKNVSELSGGQQQRVAIARALVLAPKILVLDEPLSNLDAKLRKLLRKELKNLQLNFGITTIYVTHDQEEALTLSDRVAVFNNGAVEQVGEPREIYNRSKTEFVCTFIGDANRLDKEVLALIERQLGKSLTDGTQTAYIRTEKIKTKAGIGWENMLKIPAEVVESEFYGTFSQYQYKVGKTFLKNIEKEDGGRTLTEGEQVVLYINPEDILIYEGDGNGTD